MQTSNYSNNEALIKSDIETLTLSLNDLEIFKKDIIETTNTIAKKYQIVESRLSVDNKLTTDFNYAIEANIERSDQADACIDGIISSVKRQIKLIKNEASKYPKKEEVLNE